MWIGGLGLRGFQVNKSEQVVSGHRENQQGFSFQGPLANQCNSEQIEQVLGGVGRGGGLGLGVLQVNKYEYIVGKSKGDTRDTCPPPPGGPNSFIFMHFSAENLKNNRPFGSWRTPLGKMLYLPLYIHVMGLLGLGSSPSKQF